MEVVLLLAFVSTFSLEAHAAYRNDFMNALGSDDSELADNSFDAGFFDFRPSDQARTDQSVWKKQPERSLDSSTFRTVASQPDEKTDRAPKKDPTESHKDEENEVVEKPTRELIFEFPSFPVKDGDRRGKGRSEHSKETIEELPRSALKKHFGSFAIDALDLVNHVIDHNILPDSDPLVKTIETDGLTAKIEIVPVKLEGPVAAVPTSDFHSFDLESKEPKPAKASGEGAHADPPLKGALTLEFGDPALADHQPNAAPANDYSKSAGPAKDSGDEGVKRTHADREKEFEARFAKLSNPENEVASVRLTPAVVTEERTVSVAEPEDLLSRPRSGGKRRRTFKGPLMRLYGELVESLRLINEIQRATFESNRKYKESVDRLLEQKKASPKSAADAAADRFKLGTSSDQKWIYSAFDDSVDYDDDGDDAPLKSIVQPLIPSQLKPEKGWGEEAFASPFKSAMFAPSQQFGYKKFHNPAPKAVDDNTILGSGFAYPEFEHSLKKLLKLQKPAKPSDHEMVVIEPFPVEDKKQSWTPLPSFAANGLNSVLYPMTFLPPPPIYPWSKGLKDEPKLGFDLKPDKIFGDQDSALDLPLNSLELILLPQKLGQQNAAESSWPNLNLKSSGSLSTKPKSLFQAFRETPDFEEFRDEYDHFPKPYRML